MKTLKETEYGDLTGKTYDADITVPYDVNSLKGSPEEVVGFYANGCKNIKNLEYSPRKVKGRFNCSFCPKLESLEHSPEEVVEFICMFCNKLTSLKGAPKKVCLFYSDSCDNLTSLEGAPEIVDGEFSCTECNNLESVEGAPKKCKKFDCTKCPNLKTLDYLLRCEIEEVKADKRLLEDYEKKKKIVEKHGFEKAKKVFELLDELR